MSNLQKIATEIYQELEMGQSIFPHGVLHQKLKKIVMFPEKKKASRSKKPVLDEETEAKLSGFVEEYINIFPEKTKIPTSGLYARSSPREVIDGFRWFMVTNPHYNIDTIIKATRLYVEEYSHKDPAYSYMQTAQYFVRKQNQDKTWRSNLANYCQQILDGETSQSTQESHFKQKIV